MILRRWHGRVSNEKAAQYLALMTDVALPDYRGTPGNLEAFCCTRQEGDNTHFEMVTLWQDEAAIRAFAGDDIAIAKYYDFDRDYLIELEPNVVHFEATRGL